MSEALRLEMQRLWSVRKAGGLYGIETRSAFHRGRWVQRVIWRNYSPAAPSGIELCRLPEPEALQILPALLEELSGLRNSENLGLGGSSEAETAVEIAPPGSRSCPPERARLNRNGLG